MKKIESFTSQYYFLSNFAPVDVKYEGYSYPSVEHAYQAAKTLKKSQRREILKAATPSRAKRLGRKVDLRKDWEAVKLEVMYYLVYHKFKNHRVYRKLLIATGEAELIEGNWWGDTFWGVSNGKGENHLGKILMKVRDKLSNKK